MANFKNTANNGTGLDNAVLERAGLKKSSPVDQNQDRQRNVNWLNVGVPVSTEDEQGNELKIIVTLPMGIAIDSMKVTTINGESTTNGALALRCRNALVKILQDMFAEMPEGTRKVIPELIVEAYKAPSTKRVAQADLDAEQMINSIFGKSAAKPATKAEREDVPLPTEEDAPLPF